MRPSPKTAADNKTGAEPERLEKMNVSIMSVTRQAPAAAA